jgi:hypothetical protein
MTRAVYGLYIRGATSFVSNTARAAMDDGVGPRVALLGGRWPFCAHTATGMAGQILQALCCRGTNAVAHMALMFEGLDSEDAVLAHKHGLVDATAPYVFEVLDDGSEPSFRPLVAPPWSETRRICAHYVVRSPAANETVEVYVRNVFLACVRLCVEGAFEYRWGPHCNLACPCCCCDCTRLFARRGVVAAVGGREGNCISVLLLALALGADPTVRTPAEVVQTLRLDNARPRCACCRAEAVLAAYGPPEALLALQRAGVLEREEREYRRVEGAGGGVRHVETSDRTPASRRGRGRDPTEGLW